MKVKIHSEKFVLSEEDQHILANAVMTVVKDIGMMSIIGLTKSELVDLVVTELGDKLDDDELFTFMFAYYLSDKINKAFDETMKDSIC